MAERITNPSTAVMRLTSSYASDDLRRLGWDGNTECDRELRWTIAGCGDPDLALNTLVRLVDALEEQGEHEKDKFLGDLASDHTLRVRVIALLGGSTALGDHLVAHPCLWSVLADPIPDYSEIIATMLRSVEAVPVDKNASGDLTTPGTYKSLMAPSDAKLAMKEAYRTLLMRITACDLAGTWAARRGFGAGQPEVSYELASKLLAACADAGLTAALAVAMGSVYKDADPDCELAVLAMGKCGAEELNYISDVDVIFVAEPASPKATRVASEFMRLGSGAFFEVDGNLRPEGRSGALVRTLESHLTYYERWAETWEFQAQLKARPMTGAMHLGKAYVDGLAPMVWASSQREDFVPDLQAMRRRVVANVPANLRDRELKLGNGGLRDVEFAVQMLQLVHGRVDESLRVLSTVSALRALADGGYIGREDADVLEDAYAFLRRVEHRLQIQHMRRTHALPGADDDKTWEWLAAMSGFTPSARETAVDALKNRIKRVRRTVTTLHQRLFYNPLLNSVVGLSSGAIMLSKDAATERLRVLGYMHPDRAYEHLSVLAAGTTRKSKLQALILPALMEYLAETADPDAGLLNYRKLAEAAHNEDWFLRILRDEGVAAKRLMFILGTSQYTADLFIQAPEVARLLGDGSAGPKLMEIDMYQIYRSVIATTKRYTDPDKAVAMARSLRRQELARIAAATLLGYVDVPRVCKELSVVWLAVLEATMRGEIRGWLNTQGSTEPPGRIAVIGMGRLGGEELGFGSDADVMFVVEPAEGVEEYDAVKWATRIVDKLRKRLAKPSQDPPLEVDLGLRPEGRSGAVVRTIASYERYYRQWGEAWEIQALLRASYVAGDEEVGIRFLHMIDEFRYPADGATDKQIREIRRIKARVDDERLPRGADRNTHTKLGRGALTDIEWTVQLLIMMYAHRIPELHNTSTLEVLDVFEKLDDPSMISAAEVRKLRDAWITATCARNSLVLVRGKRNDQLPQPGPQLAQVASASGWPPDEYQEYLDHYLRVTRHARQVVDKVFWGEAASYEFE